MTATPSEEQELREKFQAELWKSGIWETLSHDELIQLDRIIEAYANAKVSAVLDAIEESKPDFTKMDSYNRSFLQAMYKGTVDKAVQAQRNKLTNKEEGK